MLHVYIYIYIYVYILHYHRTLMYLYEIFWSLISTVTRRGVS